MTKRERSIPMVFRYREFGSMIAAMRVEYGFSTAEVASMVKVHQTTINKYERGIEPNMHIQNFIDLCNLYDIDPRDYFELE